MNKKAIQTFAMWAREELLSQVAQRAYQYGITAEGSGEASAAAVNGQALTTEEQQHQRKLQQSRIALGHKPNNCEEIPWQDIGDMKMKVW